MCNMALLVSEVLVMDDCTQLNELDSPTTSTPDHGRKASCTRMSFGDALSEVLTDTWRKHMTKCLTLDLSLNMVGSAKRIF